MSIRFDNKIALITGAGKGLGRAYAHWLAERGATVIVNNRIHPDVPSSAQQVVDEITAAGGTAIADHHAVQVESAAASMIQSAIERFGRIDILVCNAAIADNTPFDQISLERIREIMDINIWGTMYPLHAAYPAMLRSGYGRIVLTTSQAGLFGETGSVAYASSKAAMIGMARALARDVGDADIRANIVAPAAYTPMSAPNIDPAWSEYMSPAKVAPVVGWLCSDQCDKSGLIFNVGAGRVRRAMILESDAVDLVDENMDQCWTALADMNSGIEASSSFDSGRILMPELFSALPDMVGKR